MKKVLISPLNWGLGHATRCIPVINHLLNYGVKVFIAGDGASLKLLQIEFPGLTFFDLPSYNISYSNDDSMALKMLISIPKIRKAIAAEHEALKSIQKENSFDAIISDNRYGMWHNETYNIFITHQVNIQIPGHLKWLQPVLLNYHLKQISNFDECWIPDFEGENNLGGDLCHDCKLPRNSYYIGPLSRFQNIDYLKRIPDVKLAVPPCRLLVILSGPEPQRAILEKIITDQAKFIKDNVLIVRGITGKQEINQLKEHVYLVTYLSAHQLHDRIKDAQLIICRSGYSSIMDLAVSGKKALLIPTPGQTEQKYLADVFFKRKIFNSTGQDNFNLNDEVGKSALFSGIQLKNDELILQDRIKFLLQHNKSKQ